MSSTKDCLLALDAGTTSTRVMAFDLKGRILAASQHELEQFYPEPGWVEHDAGEIADKSLKALHEVLEELKGEGLQPLALGITNQRETVLFWNKKTGRPLTRAIVWQDRRTAGFCRELRKAGHEGMLQAKTGLLLDPYFSASKIRWMLDNADGVKELAAKGQLACGTVEAWLLFRLTGAHLSDITNASRTALFNIHDRKWDDGLADFFNVDLKIMPEVVENIEKFGRIKQGLPGAGLTVSAMIGDQQSALVGQGCLAPGRIKSTYGTGCFLIENTGGRAVKSDHRLLTTIGYSANGDLAYALEGSIFMAGSAIKWLRDALGIIRGAQETEPMAANLSSNKGVYMVPAFTGLGAPHWDAEARGAIFGLTQDTGPAEIARAVLEAVAYQTHDLLEAAVKDGAKEPAAVRIDGGMAENDWFCQFLADILDCPVDRPTVTETTALGAAFLAGLQAGVFSGLNDVSGFRVRDRYFEPAMRKDRRASLLAGWKDCINRTLSRRD